MSNAFEVTSGATPGVSRGTWAADGTITLPDGRVLTAADAAADTAGDIVGSASSAIDVGPVTTEEDVLTTGAINFKGRHAYRVTWGPNIATSDASGRALVRIRKFAATGTLLGATAASGSADAGEYIGATGQFILVNSTSYDISFPLCMTLENAGGGGETATLVATDTATPAYLIVTDLGPDTATTWTGLGTALTDAYSASVMAQNPVAYWTLADLDAGLTDMSGHGHDLTAHGGVTQSDWVDTGGALAFNGFTGYLEAPDSDAFSITTRRKLCWEIWMRPDAQNWPSTVAESYTHWFGKAGPNVNEYICRYYNASSVDRPQRTSAYAFNLVGGLGAGSYVQEPMPNGEWNMYTVTVDLDDTSTSPYGQITLYKNGARKDSDPLGAPYDIVPANGAAPLRIGSASLTSFAQAGLARVAIYDTIPSAASILARYRTVVPIAVGTATYTRTVATGASSTPGTTVVLTVPSSMAADSTPVLVAYGNYTASAVTVTDSEGNTWTSKRTGANTGTTSRLTTFTCAHVSQLTTGSTITVTWPASVTNRMAVLVELAGATTTADVDNSRQGQTAAPYIETTPLGSDDIIVASLGFEYSNTIDAIPYDPAAWATAAYIGTSADTANKANNRSLLVGVRSVAASAEYIYQAGLGTLDGGAVTAFWLGQTVPLAAA